MEVSSPARNGEIQSDSWDAFEASLAHNQITSDGSRANVSTVSLYNAKQQSATQGQVQWLKRAK